MPQPFDLYTIGEGLPFSYALPALADALPGRTAVIQAPPGSGKTTLAPPAVANAIGRRIVVTAPRRIAARAAARRLSALTGTALGELVGYSVRGDSQISADALIEFVTPGLLIRRLLRDPELADVGGVILDEVHERSIESDLLVGMLADVRMLRDDFTLIAMSATLEASTFADIIGVDSPAPLIDSPTAAFNLDVVWRASRHPRMNDFGLTREFITHIADETAHAFADAGCDALVFVPGVREVVAVATLLREQTNSDVRELHGRIGMEEQTDIVRGSTSGGQRRIIVSTDVAESSLTVPGVHLVIDSGLTREPRYDVKRGIGGLVTVAASRASADQRAGRAARTGPGCVIRLFDERTYARMPNHVTPEITTGELTTAALFLSAWGTPRGDGLALPTPPPAATIRAAETSLQTIGALDEEGRVTTVGERLSTISAPPHIGAALLRGAPLFGPKRTAQTLATISLGVRDADADLRRAKESKEVAQEAKRLARFAPTECVNDTTPSEFVDGYITALAYPERIARRVTQSPTEATYLFAGGSRATLAGSLTSYEWLAVADVARARETAGTGAVIRLAAPLDEETALTAGRSLLVEEARATWDSGKVSARNVRALGAIELTSTPAQPTPKMRAEAIREGLHEKGLDLLNWTPDAVILRERLAFLHHHLGEKWPAADDDSLLNHLDEWFGPELNRLADGAPMRDINVAVALRRIIPWQVLSDFDRLAPERLTVPSGSNMRVTYPPLNDPARAPIVAVKLQECFGLAQSPTIADGRVSVQFHLLSPGKAPLAITDDLASFWAGPYAQVRAEMRGRYPKHPWPEDPWNHVATARTKRGLARD